MKKKFSKFWKEVKKVINKPIMRILPGQLAFYLVLSIIPIVYLVGIIGSMFNLSVDSFIEFIKTSFPASTSNLIIPIISGTGLDWSVLFFIISAFLMASNGAHSIIIISNTLYEIKNGNYLKRRFKALIVTIIIVILIGFTIIVPAFGNIILNSIKNLDNIKPVFNNILLIYNIIKIPLSIIFIYFFIKLIYTAAPDKQIKSKDCTLGAVFTTLGWVITTQVYSYYASHFTRYDIFYGSIANLIILLLWIYLLSYIFVFGLALNASITSSNEEELAKTNPQLNNKK
ncbi:MAG: YihY/virulence factor BrkB family protein [Bacilli bacterium]|nr:YihY/virulence factor BrkB family protein [Bacilli bacterium]